jgi:CRP-like cAMP-binding protein
MGTSIHTKRERSGLQANPDSIGGLHLNHLLSECVADCELAAAIEARSRLVQISKKRQLFRQGQSPDRLFLLRAGEVVLTTRRTDGAVLGFRAVAGSLIGLPAIAGNQPYSMTATVTRYSQLHAISMQTFRELVGMNPRLSMRVSEILAAEVRSARLQLAAALSSVTPGTVSGLRVRI